MLKRTELKRKTEIKPGPPIERKTELRKVSKGLCAKKRAQRRAYAAADDAEQGWCSVCGKPGPVEHSHHFSQKQYPQHANDERNWLQMGKHCGCHDLYENKRPVFAAQRPAIWAEIVRCMKLVDLAAYTQAEALNPTLYSD